MLSVIIITKNEEDNIRACLESIIWADEIIVLDSGSNDNTELIAREYTDNFFLIDDWKGFGIQKQRALKLATQEWVLSLDADETISSKLQNEIKLTISDLNNYDGYYIPRLTSYLGKNILHSGWYPDLTLRLAKRNKANFSDDIIHEKLMVSGEIGRLKSNILHNPFKNIHHHLEKLNYYSTLAAEKMFLSGKKISWVSVFLKSLFGFFRAYFLRLGLLDGWRGVVVSISTGLSVYMKYLKLKEMEEKDKLSQK